MHIAFEWWHGNVYRWTWAASRQWHSLSTFHLDARFIFPFLFHHLFLYESFEHFCAAAWWPLVNTNQKTTSTPTTTTASNKPSHGIQIYFRASRRWRVHFQCDALWYDQTRRKHMRHTCFLEKSIRTQCNDHTNATEQLDRQKKKPSIYVAWFHEQAQRNKCGQRITLRRFISFECICFIVEHWICMIFLPKTYYFYNISVEDRTASVNAINSKNMIIALDSKT